MAVVRELRARFTAEARALKKVMDDVRRSTRELAKGQDAAQKSMQGVGKESDTMAKRFKTADGRMMRLNRTTADTGRTFSDAGKNTTGFRDNLSKTDKVTSNTTRTFKTADGRLASLNRSFLESNKTFRTTGGSLTSLGKHFTATEVSALTAGRQAQTTSGQMMRLNRSASESARTFRTTGGSITTLGKHFTAAETKAMTLGKQVKTTAGGVAALDTTVGKSTKTFRTSGGDIRSLGKHFTAAETNARLMGQSVSASGDTVASTSRSVQSVVRDRVSAPFRGAIDNVRGFTRSIRDIVASLGVFSLVSGGINMVKNSLAGAISRYDTLNNYPRVLELMGFDAKESSKSIDRLSEGIDGLPTSLDSVVGTAQRIAIITDDLDSATETTLALNNAFLASGSSAWDAQRGLEQYVQMLSRGEVDLEAWRSLQETMPVALTRTAEAFGFTGRSAQNDLYDALKEGDITFDQFNEKIIELSNKTGGFADMAKESGAGIATAWTNMKTAVVRGTANIIESVDKSLGGVGSIAGFIDRMKVNVNNGFKTMEKAVPPVITVFKFLHGILKDVSDRTEPLRDGIHAVIEAFKGNDTPMMAFMGNLGKTWDETQRVVNGIHNLRDGIKAFFKLVQGDTTGAQALFVRMGLTYSEIERVFRLINTLKENLSRARDFIVKAFETARPYVEAALSAVLDVVMSVVEKIIDFWKSDGKQISEAAKNVFSGILKVVEFVWPLVLAIIKTVWGNIKGVINGGLNVIMGLVKVFSGLFTGDFSKMWEGIKQLFKGAVEFIWNFVQLTFYGKILKGAGTFISSFSGGLSKMWQGIKALFTGSVSAAWQTIHNGWLRILASTRSVFRNVWTFLRDTWNSIKSITSGAITLVRNVVSKGWTAIRNTTSTVWNAIKTVISTVWNGIKTTITTVVNSIRNFVTNGWNGIRNTTTTVFNKVWGTIKSIFTSIWNFIKSTVNLISNGIRGGWNGIWNTTKTVFKGIWNTIKSIFTNTWNFIRTTVGNIKTTITNTWNGIKTTTSNVFRGIYNTIRDRFNDIVSRAKELPKKIGDGIGSMASKVTGGVTKVVNTLASTLGKGVNGVISGINWVLGKLGVNEKNYVPKWTVPKYAKGTDGHPGGPAIVGDGKGAYKGQELIQHPDGTTYLSPDTDTLVNLPAGTQVLNAKDTKEVLYPHYAKGIGSKIKKTTSNAWGKVKETALNVFDYVKNPGKLLDLALNTLGIQKPNAAGFVGNMAKGAWDKVKSGSLNFLKGMIEKAGNFTGGKFGPPFRLTSRAGMRFHPILRTWKMHYGDDYGAPPGTPIPSQSGGVVTQAGYHSIRGNYVKVKSGIYELVYQHLKDLFVRSGQSVSKGQTLGTVGSTGRSTGPHLHFETWKKGRFVPPATMGYADGGIVDRAQLAWIAEGGWAESIISHDPAKRVSQRAIWEQTGRELGFTGDNSEVIGLLGRIAAAVERGMDLAVILNDREVGRILEPIVTEYQKRREGRMRRFDAGVETT